MCEKILTIIIVPKLLLIWQYAILDFIFKDLSVNKRYSRCHILKKVIYLIQIIFTVLTLYFVQFKKVENAVHDLLTCSDEVYQVLIRLKNYLIFL